MSSLVDTWLLLRNIEANGERNRLLFIMKSRGSAHSNQVREFQLTDEGPQLVDVYVGADGVLTGSARLQQIQEDEDAQEAFKSESERRRMALAQQRAATEAQIAALQAQLEADTVALHHFEDSDDQGRGAGSAARAAQARGRTTINSTDGGDR